MMLRVAVQTSHDSFRQMIRALYDNRMALICWLTLNEHDSRPFIDLTASFHPCFELIWPI